MVVNYRKISMFFQIKITDTEKWLFTHCTTLIITSLKMMIVQQKFPGFLNKINALEFECVYFTVKFITIKKYLHLFTRLCRNFMLSYLLTHESQEFVFAQYFE